MEKPQVHSCGLSLREHVGQLFAGLMVAGMGGGCVGTYQALIEMAELVRRENDFSVYTPQLTSQLRAEMQQAADKAELDAAFNQKKIAQA